MKLKVERAKIEEEEGLHIFIPSSRWVVIKFMKFLLWMGK